ncbi:tumor protein D53 isoform X4 [Rhineura floridana]|uniref:tumor protein D53 isoform X4 n=1 Tax=Rhineura floridana TaxID=261503 RepID=UPI002AC8483C|nr:tumor protein D53 isoform X4 [Rhineura floridana]
MEAQAQGLLERQALHETDEDMVTDVDFTNMISEEEQEELKAELVKLEDEIVTLRQVLAAKDKQLLEIKQKLGINLMNELKQNFSKSWHNMQTTTAYKKTQETLSQAGQKATAAISNVGTVISKKFGDMRCYRESFEHSPHTHKQRECEMLLYSPFHKYACYEEFSYIQIL